MTILCWRELEKGLLASMALDLDYPDEYITYISGSFSLCSITGTKTHRLFKLRFQTSYGRSQMFSFYSLLGGSEKFELMKDGVKVIGFHGRCTHVPNAIGAYIRATDFRKSVFEGGLIQKFEEDTDIA
ncbi:unnamed protein product [Arabidopsis lyrata]|uniref:Jacalin-type lectin domain-containing protein n=1 Tax=Arabidopsis lyrata subsp. lyrata TaxID=81972 RepID=D7MSI3_ARALL|nr:hypothetical protein ARALYDRAFT_919212 [Arabidopsis lyrata subsp. lyrata]CAH8280269.1 unnamed protein product [Arabidopsis lyrata]